MILCPTKLRKLYESLARWREFKTRNDEQIFFFFEHVYSFFSNTDSTDFHWGHVTNKGASPIRLIRAIRVRKKNIGFLASKRLCLHFILCSSLCAIRSLLALASPFGRLI